MFPTMFKLKILFKVTVRFIWSEKRQRGTKSANVNKHNASKTLKHYVVCEHFCPSHVRGHAGCLTVKTTPMIPRHFMLSSNCIFCFHCFD